MAHPFESSDNRSADESRRRLSGYDEIASEYYDPRWHPTCANFREGSRRVLKTWLQSTPWKGRVLCEIGAGKSLVAELVVPRLHRLDRLFLVDDSPSMLAYSRKWENQGAHLVVGAASSIPVADSSVDVVVSSLGDPYNKAGFWAEVRRILRPRGRAFFTTPSYDWARTFRGMQEMDMNVAEFELSGGKVVLVPSYILPVSDQIRLTSDHGLNVYQAMDVPVAAVGAAPISPKLLVRRGPDASMVTGYALSPSGNGTRPVQIVGLVGHIGSGKTSAGSFLEARGFRRIALSDLLLEEAKLRKLNHDRAHLQELGNALRREFGGSILVDRALLRYLSGARGTGLVIDGLRNPAEVQAVRRAGGNVLGIARPPADGFSDEATQRAQRRESDPNEPVWGQRVAEALRLADLIVDNKGSMEELQDRVANALSHLKGGDPGGTRSGRGSE